MLGILLKIIFFDSTGIIPTIKDGLSIFVSICVISAFLIAQKEGVFKKTSHKLDRMNILNAFYHFYNQLGIHKKLDEVERFMDKVYWLDGHGIASCKTQENRNIITNTIFEMHRSVWTLEEYIEKYGINREDVLYIYERDVVRLIQVKNIFEHLYQKNYFKNLIEKDTIIKTYDEYFNKVELIYYEATIKEPKLSVSMNAFLTARSAAILNRHNEYYGKTSTSKR